jgi:tRNA 2-thiouridine synthesizing protein B
MLHTVNKSPFERDSLNTCLRLAKAGSDILLIEDGVYGALAGTTASEKVQKAMATMRFHVLEPDLKARGINGAKLIPGIQAVGYDGFVKLAADNDRVQAWL